MRRIDVSSFDVGMKRGDKEAVLLPAQQTPAARPGPHQDHGRTSINADGSLLSTLGDVQMSVIFPES